MTKETQAIVEQLLNGWSGERAPMPSVQPLLSIVGPADEEQMSALTGAVVTDIHNASNDLLAHYLGWTIKALGEWQPDADRYGLRLTAGLVAVKFWDIGDGFWAKLSQHHPQHEGLVSGLKRLVSGAKTEVVVPIGAPQYEIEILESLRKAEARGDWAELEAKTSAFRDRNEHTYPLTEAIRGLYRLAPNELIALADRQTTWFDVRPLAGALRTADALELACRSASGLVRFAALEAVLRLRRPLTALETEALANLFREMSSDEEAWPSWLSVFNRSPTRFPHIQHALGQALPRCTDIALRAYVDSINLSTPTAHGRIEVAVCLSEFSATASMEARRSLSRRAWDRWTIWNFGVEGNDETATADKSELDYAVLMWLGSFEDKESVTQEMQRVESEFLLIEKDWHSDIMGLQRKVSRLTARWKIYAIAQLKGADAPDAYFGEDAPTMDFPMSDFHRYRYAPIR
ncbi:hypothetical protein IE4771_PB00281 (plasmid) [Rhizobium etli bv. mimosae str. IE4771]|uniref:Uncharacterized protein n=1 Tax=Rhizobium etli bv. mimosae str. IE4771 TaxID=1432050 RepID=A0A060I8G9_RHIET|nr:hypothetical protein [Rhizobium sp. IE4771]AIC30009.1 hypothetical protein IE4771_PB00281 [Rhizobium sp. IE4771]